MYCFVNFYLAVFTGVRAHKCSCRSRKTCTKDRLLRAALASRRAESSARSVSRRPYLASLQIALSRFGRACPPSAARAIAMAKIQIRIEGLLDCPSPPFFHPVTRNLIRKAGYAFYFHIVDEVFQLWMDTCDETLIDDDGRNLDYNSVLHMCFSVRLQEYLIKGVVVDVIGLPAARGRQVVVVECVNVAIMT